MKNKETQADLQECLRRISSLHPRLIDLSLGRIARLLEQLGAPHRDLPPVVHIAGTNGKGSTLAFLEAMARAGGLRVQRYTSPHLCAFNERIRLASGDIDHAHLISLLERCLRLNRGEEITFFELTTAAAFCAFAQESADILLLETGLGGRLDATNVIEHPRLTIITPVGLDHAAFLGTKYEQVAREKAGIIKPGCPLIMAPQRPEVAEVLYARAADHKAPVYAAGVHWDFEDNDQGELIFTPPEVSLPAGDTPLKRAENCVCYPAPALLGPHQRMNAATALAAAHVLGSPFALAARRAGLTQARWPGRLQKLRRGPLLKDWTREDSARELWLDGAHNPCGAVALAQAWRAFSAKRPILLRPCLIVALTSNRPVKEILKPLAAIGGELVAVPLPAGNGYPPAEIAHAAQALGMPARTASCCREAVRLCIGRAQSCLIFGSLYLLGAVLKENS